MGGLLHAPAGLTPGVGATGAPWMGGGVGPGAGLGRGGGGKKIPSQPPPELKHTHPVRSLVTS